MNVAALVIAVLTLLVCGLSVYYTHRVDARDTATATTSSNQLSR